MSQCQPLLKSNFFSQAGKLPVLVEQPTIIGVDNEATSDSDKTNNIIINNKNDKDNNENACEMWNPLIVAFGICDYDNNVLPNLECVPNDYKNVQHAFHVERSYDFVYFGADNNIIHKRNSNNDNYNIAIDNKNHFKLKWKEEEIFQFNDKIYEILNNTNYNYDGLVYFISCHGDTGGIIYDSHGSKVPLITIFEKFCNHKCIQLQNKPKIYFIEACRGDMRTKNYHNSQFKSKHPIFLQHDHDNDEDDTKQVEPNKNDMSIAVSKPQKSLKLERKSNFNSIGVNIFSKYNYNREIYANTEGYAVVEPSNKCAYMTRSITKSIVNDKIFSKDFNQIMIHTRNIMLKLMGITVDCAAQVIDDHNHCPKKIFFKPKKE